VKQSKKLSRAERVRLAAEKFQLAPQAVEAELDGIALKIKEEARRGAVFGNKAQRKVLKKLADAARRTRGYASSNELPPILRSVILINDVVEQLDGLREACDAMLSAKLTPRRDDADGFEKRAAAHAALSLLSGRQPSMLECQELTAILYGVRSTAAVRVSFKAFLKKASKALEKNQG
jgi:hypothetical protein